MVSQIDHFDVIVADSEFEALVLENSLIKRHQPRYNILLKDDKGYPYIRLSGEEYPRFSLANRAAEDGARYFGPYGSRHATQAYRGRPARRPAPALLQPEALSPGHREGAALPQLPHGPVRRLLPQPPDDRSSTEEAIAQAVLPAGGAVQGGAERT